MKNSLEHKTVSLELKDFDSSKRTAVIAHCVYNVIDRVGDISCKGMFDKTWKENKSVDFLFNHDPEQVVGATVRTFDDEEKAYTEVKFGNWTLGNDVLEMADMGVLKGASFGYNTEKKEFATVKGKKVRKLKEVFHGETSLLTKIPANPLAGIVTLNKSFESIPEFKMLSMDEQAMLKNMLSCDQMCLKEMMDMMGMITPQSDLYTWITYQISQRASMMGDMMGQLKWNSGEMKAFEDHIQTMEKFVRSSKASDETIILIQKEIEEAKQILSEYDTAATLPITEPDASKKESKEFADSLYLLTLKTF
jgi:HK97 family phage prohead protease